MMFLIKLLSQVVKKHLLEIVLGKNLLILLIIINQDLVCMRQVHQSINKVTQWEQVKGQVSIVMAQDQVPMKQLIK